MKKKHTFRTVLILVFTALSIFYIIPTFTLNSVEQQEKSKISELASLTGMTPADIYYDIYRTEVDFNFNLTQMGLPPDTVKKAQEIVDFLRTKLYDKVVKARGKAIKQGLDLQGGMHLVMEVDLVKMLDNLARKKDDQYYNLVRQVSEQVKADPQTDFYDILTRVFNQANVPLNAYFGDLRSSESDIVTLLKKESSDAVDRSMEILRNRIDQFGVSEPSIQRQGSHRIVLELPGVQDPARARALVGKTALLEFLLLADPDKTQKTLSEIDTYLKNDIAFNKTGSPLETVKTDTSAPKAAAPADTAAAKPKESKDEVVNVKKLFGEETSTPAGSDTTALVDKQMMEEHPFYTLLRNVENEIGVPEQNFALVNRIIHRQEVLNLIPSDYQFLWSKNAEAAPDGNKYYHLYFLKKEPEITGANLRDAQVQIGSGGGGGGDAAGTPIVSIEFDREGARTFSRVTGANVGKFLAIVLDDKVHMAPRIKTKIPDGRAIIEGSKDMEEANDLTIVLKAGALPAPVDIIEERTVGPSLGKDSITQGVFSGIVGIGIVIITMIIYYRLSGAIANLALMFNILFLLAVLAGFHGTLTMPGIAGVILTIGMAVDSNVLIFERIREELRIGKTIKAAIEAGYARAMVTILDSNITTLISAIVLYQFGTGPIKGFALTLMIGLSASMFTAIVITRAIFDWMTDKYSIKKLSI